jgi:hypothetical protein
VHNIIYGDHGAYIQINKNDLCIGLKVKEGQEWRLTPEYKNIKYLWKYPIGMPDVKVYEQKNTVKYAPYIVGMFYINPFDLIRR